MLMKKEQDTKLCMLCKTIKGVGKREKGRKRQREKRGSEGNISKC